MKDIQFSAVNTRIRTYEIQLFPDSFLERLLTAKDADDVYTMLRDSSYGNHIYEDTAVHDFEDVLLAEQKDMYDLLYEISPDRRVIDYFTLRHDYQNLKVLIKEKYINQDLSHLLVPLGSVPIRILKELVNIGRSEHVDEQMNICMKEVSDYIEDYNESVGIDIIFDNHYWVHMLTLAKKAGYPEFDQLIQRNIDIFNISTTLRAYLIKRVQGFLRAVLADGGTLSVDNILESIHSSLDDFVDYLRDTPFKNLIDQAYEEIQEHKTLNDFDLIKDNFLMKRYRENKIVPFGPTAIMGYIYAKETEIKNIRIILIGKINKIPEDILRKRMRDSYV